MSEDVVAVQATATGRVQGVFFRASTRRVAHDLGVVGWVCNEPDGSVGAWLEGPADAVAEVVAWMRAGGPTHATVTDVSTEDVHPAGYRAFDISD